jgi:hypothetical protein
MELETQQKTVSWLLTIHPSWFTGRWMDGWKEGWQKGIQSPFAEGQKQQQQQQQLLHLRGTLHAWLATGGSLVDLKEQLCSFFLSFFFFFPTALLATNFLG